MSEMSRDKLKYTEIRQNRRNTKNGLKSRKNEINSGKTEINREEKIVIKVLFICHGNICRSTMAQSILQHMVEERGIASDYYIDSAATSREEIGNGVHYGTVRKLNEVGIPVVPHRARQMTANDYREFDYLIGMDSANIRNMTRIAGGDPSGKIYKLLEFSGKSRDVADPWYTGDFDATYRDVCEGLNAFINQIS